MPGWPEAPPRRPPWRRSNGRRAEALKETGRIVGLDYGRRRIGVAVSDPTGTIAAPHSVILAAPPPDRPPEELVELIREMEPVEVVLGIPLQMDGVEGEMAREARAFGRALAERTGVEVVEWDERLTTEMAERDLRALELPRRKRREKGRADMLAAAGILRAYLSSRRRA